MSNSENYISKIDTERFGFKIAKFDNAESLTLRTLNDVKNQGVKLIISRVNAKNVDDINKLENIGFQIKDIQTIYRYFLCDINFKEYTKNQSLTVRCLKIEDINILISISEEAFKGYGHYFADRILNPDKCIEIYKDWTLRSCTNKKVADKVFVAEIDNQIAGFLSFKILDSSEGKYAAGGIGAVKKEFRNQDVFRGLARYGLLWGQRLNLVWEEHNVLITNFSVNNSFSQIGFKVFKSFITLHKWL